MRAILIPDTAMISDSAMGDNAIVQEFYRYMHYSYGDISGSILGTGPDSDVYAALFYSGEVRNGGHDQFIGNSAESSRIFDAALSGLAEIGAWPQHALLSEMIAWFQINPQYWDNPRYEKVRPPALASLDNRFFDEEDRDSVEARATAWIKTYPDLRVVPEADFMALLQDCAARWADRRSPPPRSKVGLWDRILMGIFGR